MMEKLLILIGAGIGILGVVMCAAAVVSRFAGTYYLAGVQIGTIMNGSVAAVAIGTLCLVGVLVLRTPPRG
jgi:hypothetical protein